MDVINVDNAARLGRLSANSKQCSKVSGSITFQAFRATSAGTSAVARSISAHQEGGKLRAVHGSGSFII
jgi:hypothetical protein